MQKHIHTALWLIILSVALILMIVMSVQVDKMTASVKGMEQRVEDLDATARMYEDYIEGLNEEIRSRHPEFVPPTHFIEDYERPTEFLL